MEATRHYLERASERFGIKEPEATKLMEKASQRGKSGCELHSLEKKYLSTKEESGCHPVYYQEKIFIFTLEGDNCITVYAAPEWFGRKRHYECKMKIRDAKKYLKYSTNWETA